MIAGADQDVLDELWSAFGETGIEDAYDILEQVTLLLYVRRLDKLQTAAESKARLTGTPIGTALFSDDEQHLRWSVLKNVAPASMFADFKTGVMDLVRGVGGIMADARFTIPNASTLSRAVDLVDRLPYAGARTNGAVYDNLISRIDKKKGNGGYPTPRHLVDLIVAMVEPQLEDLIGDPASGTGGFLTAASTYLRDNHPDLLIDPRQRAHFEKGAFWGFDNDPEFVRMTNMNLLLHGIASPNVERRDSLAAMQNEQEEQFTLVLLNPPFSGGIEKSTIDKDLERLAGSATQAPLFVARALSMLKRGGRAAVIVPEGVLFGSQKKQVELRRTLVDDHRLEAVIKVPGASYEPFSTTSTAILFFTKTGAGGTDNVWFYDIRADGYSLDKRRTATAANDFPDVLARWKTLGANSPELARARTEQSFLVSRGAIAAKNYELAFNSYAETTVEDVETRAPAEIISEIRALNRQIDNDVTALEELLG